MPAHGWLGLVLAISSWILNWSLAGLRTHVLFFPLWLGYCLTVDGLVFRRKGSSMLTRSRDGYVRLFLISAPAWWLFEAINWRTQNWVYLGRSEFSDLEYFLLASLSFSTVIPAVFGTSELLSTFPALKRYRLSKRTHFSLDRPLTLAMFVLGWMMMVLLLAWPRYFFPLLWISIFLILEPVNVWMKNRSLLATGGGDDQSAFIALPLGCLVCGFFWEMWNVYSMPKWTYQIPFFDFLRVFEMPLLGYLGYIPFSLELMAFYQIVLGLLSQSDVSDFIGFLPEESTSP